MADDPEARHRLHEDALALGLGTLFVALGVAMYAKATLVVSGMAGLALLVQYASGWPFWAAFSLLNLPFYALALWRMGSAFALRTALAVSLVALLARLTPGWVVLGDLDPLYAAVAGGGLMGVGMLMLFRHRTGLGGINILAIYLQERAGIRAGYLQLGIDLAILAAAATLLAPDRLLLSVLGSAVLNLTLAINHRPGRYLGRT